jgi:hypothetical protein
MRIKFSIVVGRLSGCRMCYGHFGDPYSLRLQGDVTIQWSLPILTLEDNGSMGSVQPISTKYQGKEAGSKYH